MLKLTNIYCCKDYWSSRLVWVNIDQKNSNQGKATERKVSIPPWAFNHLLRKNQHTIHGNELIKVDNYAMSYMIWEDFELKTWKPNSLLTVKTSWQNSLLGERFPCKETNSEDVHTKSISNYQPKKITIPDAFFLWSIVPRKQLSQVFN